MPTGALDFHKVIKYVVKNATELGVDTTKIIIGGYSGGAMIASAAAYELGKSND